MGRLLSSTSEQRWRRWVFHLLLVITAMLVYGFIALSLGKDMQFDLLSYHYYAPYAFFHHRQEIDYWPASYLVMFLNPALDFLTYFLIHFCKPQLAEFTIGAIQSLNFWIVFCISYLFVRENEKTNPVLFSLIIAVISMYAPVAVFEIGMFNGDTIVSLFVLMAVYLQINLLQGYGKSGELNKAKLIMSGIFLGIGVGLKLTSGIYLIGFVIGFYFTPLQLQTRLFAALVWGLSAIVGILLSSGYWMLHLWDKYQNPFFPMLNQFFHSPYFDNSNFTESFYYPATFLQAIFYPFYFSGNGHMISPHPFVDYRLAIVYALFIISGIVWFLTKTNRDKPNYVLSWFFPFFISSYVVWEYVFSIARYYVPLEMLTPITIYLLIRYLHAKFTAEKQIMLVFVMSSFLCLIYIFAENFKIALSIFAFWLLYIGLNQFHAIKKIPVNLQLMCIIFGTLAVTFSPMSQVKLLSFQNGKTYFNVQLPTEISAIPNALVLMSTFNYTHSIPRHYIALVPTSPSPITMGNKLLTYLIPSFPEGWRFAGITETDPDNKRNSPVYYVVTQELKTRVDKYQGPMFLLGSKMNMSTFYDLAKALGLQAAGKCLSVFSDRTRLELIQLKNNPFHFLFNESDFMLQLCPVKPMAIQVLSKKSQPN